MELFSFLAKEKACSFSTSILNKNYYIYNNPLNLVWPWSYYNNLRNNFYHYNMHRRYRYKRGKESGTGSGLERLSLLFVAGIGCHYKACTWLCFSKYSYWVLYMLFFHVLSHKSLWPLLGSSIDVFAFTLHIPILVSQETSALALICFCSISSFQIKLHENYIYLLVSTLIIISQLCNRGNQSWRGCTLYVLDHIVVHAVIEKKNVNQLVMSFQHHAWELGQLV